MCEGMGRITDPCHPDTWWQTHGLSWWEGALTGHCLLCEIPVNATIEGGGIRMQHGLSSEHSRWFSLGNLNQVGGCVDARESWVQWLEQVHAYEGGGCPIPSGGGCSGPVLE